ncbi:hypothetical protein CLAIMM_10705 [Cladophialophora immunda]|nr:hypothetical protein CLAIMM_10705 [Cladophialophora immunda]
MMRFIKKEYVRGPPPSPSALTGLTHKTDNPHFLVSSKDSDRLSKADLLSAQRHKGQKVTPEELRRLREMMRQRYALDLEIWSLRKVGRHNKGVVEDKMRRADALLAGIRAAVGAMDGRDYFHHEADYQKLKEVKARVMAGGKKDWVQNPPWNED